MINNVKEESEVKNYLEGDSCPQTYIGETKRQNFGHVTERPQNRRDKSRQAHIQSGKKNLKSLTELNKSLTMQPEKTTLGQLKTKNFRQRRKQKTRWIKEAIWI